MPHQHPQDDLLVVIALARYSHQFRDAELANSEQAWQMAVNIADQHGLDPVDAVHQLESE